MQPFLWGSPYRPEVSGKDALLLIWFLHLVMSDDEISKSKQV